MSEWNTVEGTDFDAKVKVGENVDDTWVAKVRLEDDGQRGKNVVLSADSADELTVKLDRFANAFAQTRNKVNELAQPNA
jgi:hypothetical protein